MQWPTEIHGHEALVRLPRNAGVDPLPGLVALELALSQQAVRRIVLVSDAGDSSHIERLRRLNYRELSPGRYAKTIPTRRAVRFSITEMCNYRCFFCHEEGLEMDRVRHDAREEGIFRLLDQLKALHYNDFTFSGGEPLLKWRQVLRYLDYMRQIDYLPDVKFVSNGLVLPAEFLRRVQDYPGRVRFNISMHSLDADLHQRIVLQADWEIDYYASLGEGHSALALSIGTTPGRASALVRCNREVAAVPGCLLTPLTRSVGAWLAGV